MESECPPRNIKQLLEQLGGKASYFKPLGNSKFIIQEILNYTLISRKS